MRSTTFVLPLLACLATAKPHNHNHARQHVPSRQIKARNEPVIEWVTEYEYETEVVPCTTTIWVSEGFVAPAETTSTTTTSTTTNVPAQFFQPVSKEPSPSPSPSPTTLATSVAVVSVAEAPAPVSTTSVQPTTTAPPPPPVVVEPVPTTSSPAAVVAPPVPTTTTPAPAPVPVVSSAPSSDSGSGSSGGECSEGSACTGDITHYDAGAGIGACGWMTDGDSENVLALSHILMGTQSNGNPYCGKTVTVTLNGKSIVARVVDKCMGCEVHAIDLSNKAFAALADMGIGRTQVEWYFN